MEVTMPLSLFLFFFFNDTATTEIYTLSLHDALPISPGDSAGAIRQRFRGRSGGSRRDRKSTRLNSSHTVISYAVFCLKKKKIVPATRESHPPLLDLVGTLLSSSGLASLFFGVIQCPFYFNDTATTEIYPLSLHDALPI